MDAEDFEVEIPEPVAAPRGNFRGFVMTLQKTDVGRGQTTAGTSARSPEIFIPLQREIMILNSGVIPMILRLISQSLERWTDEV